MQPVFLGSRMRDQCDKHGDGMEVAAIGMSDVLTVELFGVGMVFAVLVDVLVVRILLETAVMRLLGRAAWWAPSPPARFYGRFGIKESGMPADDPAARPVPVAVD
ncbi:hypothetical protein AB5J49_35590 [Streptomyces sp. R28]|uniref:Membrane transport protein MMPL domain-containing protein n=1 Tax=Streptomyces sp. R28 TaxID=3238628 RepID=A0AB39Q7G3_9ACTN